MRLADLLRLLLAETDIERLRLSSVEPMDFSDDLLGLMAESPRIAKHVHAPLQSGSDRILRRMHRKYRPRHYADRILKARALMPDCRHRRGRHGGLPGRDRGRFRREPRASSQSCRSLICTCSRIRSGPGRPRPPTPMPCRLPARKERNRMLRELAAAKNLASARAWWGRRSRR